MRQTIKSFLCAAVAFAAATLSLSAAEPYNGQTTNGIYTISSFTQLTNFTTKVRSYVPLRSSTFILTEDIDCNRQAFTSRDRSRAAYFYGTFDGGGHKIYRFNNQTWDNEEYQYGGSLFDILTNGAVIRNLTLDGDVVVSQSNRVAHVGAFAGSVTKGNAESGPVTFDNCHFKGSVKNHHTHARVAAFVGQVNRSISDSSTSTLVVFTNCTMTSASISGDGNNGWAGCLVANGDGVEAIDCTAESCGVHSRGTWLGGLAGRLTNSSFTRCSFSGSVNRRELHLGEMDDEPEAPDYDIGVGGIVGLTENSCTFHDCSFSGTVKNVKWDYGHFAGFVGCTAGSETFSNCTVSVSFTADECAETVGGFAGIIASREASFTDCAVHVQAAGSGLHAGFYDSNQEYYSRVPFGTNYFTRCSVAAESAIESAGFAKSPKFAVFTDCSVSNAPSKSAGFVYCATNSTFTGCSVVGGSAPNGFVSDAYDGNTFDDCSVVGASVRNGFVGTGGSAPSATAIGNTFRRCRAVSCLFDNTPGVDNGFAAELNSGAVVEDCLAHGAAKFSKCELYGFAGTVAGGATVSRCVAAVLPPDDWPIGAGFAGVVESGATVSDSYSVYAPRIAAASGDSQNGMQAGFVRRFDGTAARCFTLGPIPARSAGVDGCGTFMGAGTTWHFSDCYAPMVTGFNIMPNGVSPKNAENFASASEFPNYDFENVWRDPAGAANSPYLPASTDADTNFWTLVVVRGHGRVLVNGGEPAAVYPAGTVLTLRAEPVGESQFTGWIGDGIADPTALETTYTVRNAGAILATFGIEPFTGQTEPGNYTISTYEQLTNLTAVAHDYGFAGSTISLTMDIDCGGGSLVGGGRTGLSRFGGTFDGGGHRIFNYCNTVTSDSGGTGAALFDVAAPGAVIKDLTLEGGVRVTVPSCDNVAVFASYVSSDYLSGGVTFENCHFTGTISNVMNVAVFACSVSRQPYTRDGVITLYMTNCTANAFVYSSNTNAITGGLVATGESVVATDCSFVGSLHGLWTLGGIAGHVQNSAFTRCTFSGTATGGRTERIKDPPCNGGCGGLAGFVSNSVFRACSAEADIDWDFNHYQFTTSEARAKRLSAANFIAAGGVAGVTMGPSEFIDCTFSGTVRSKSGFAAGFVGWTAGSETFSNCVANADLPLNDYGHSNSPAGGFAASVASAGAKFIDCRVTASGVMAGFYDVQYVCNAVGYIGTNSFTRCFVAGSSSEVAGFVRSPTNAVFSHCEVAGGTVPFGFAMESCAGCSYADCIVTGATVRVGFVGETSGTNSFARCRAECLYAFSVPEFSSLSYELPSAYSGFADKLGDFAELSNCLAYGAISAEYFDQSCVTVGFARYIDDKASLRYCSSAVTKSTGISSATSFADYVQDGASLVHCHAVSDPDARLADMPATMDDRGRFWTTHAVVAGKGVILVNGATPDALAYNKNETLTIRAEPQYGYEFSHWVGQGYGDPGFAETTYSVTNCGVIAAAFAKKVGTGEELLAIGENPTVPYSLTADIDLSGAIDKRYTSVLGDFCSIFLGRGHTIRGVDFTDHLANSQYLLLSRAALFNRIMPGAQVRDLSVEVSATNVYAVVAGLALSISDHTLVSNCNVRTEFHASPEADAESNSVKYYGIASNVVGSAVKIIDCTASGEIAGLGRASGLFGSVEIYGGSSEISRCASFCDVSATAPDGIATGFATSMELRDGAKVHEIVTSGTIYGTDTGAGLATEMRFGNAASKLRDAYSTAEIRAATSYGVAAGVARSISTEAANVSIDNVWFGGSTRAGFRQNYGFAETVDGVALDNCTYVSPHKEVMQGTEGVTPVPFASRLSLDSWSGYDIGGTWSMSEGATTPYFAWSLADGKFRVFATRADGTEILHDEYASPGQEIAVAGQHGITAYFVEWVGGAWYGDTTNITTTMKIDNHHAANCIWGRNIWNPQQLQAMADDLSGDYRIVGDIDMSGIKFTPIGRVRYSNAAYSRYTGFYPFFGKVLANLNTISNLVAHVGSSGYAGLFCRLREAYVSGVRLVGPQMFAAYAGALAGESVDSTVRDCSAVGAYVYNNYSGALGGLVGSIAGESAFTRCYASGYVNGFRDTGGFAGIISGTSRARQCFASGAVQNAGDRCGGFAGRISGAAEVSDCYTVSDVRYSAHEDTIGGFVGAIADADVSVARCYASGLVENPSGGFAGSCAADAHLEDCIFQDYDDYHVNGRNVGDIGGMRDHPAVTSFRLEEMRKRKNFMAFLDTLKWSQIDGKTHPYFDWCLMDGKMPVVSMTVNRNARFSADTNYGSFSDMELVDPGSTATLTAEGPVGVGEPFGNGKTFFEWLGLNSEAGESFNSTTAAKVDNFRTAVGIYGLMISSGDDLYNITNDVNGAYGLANDIALPGDWESLHKYPNYYVFKGRLYGAGHSILFSSDKSLFHTVSNAYFRGVTLRGSVIGSSSGFGALSDVVKGPVTLQDCRVDMCIETTRSQVGGFFGTVENGGSVSFERCAAYGSILASGLTGGFVGNFIKGSFTFIDCDSAIDVIAIDSSYDYGGFIGKVDSDGNGSGSFLRCTASGNVYGKSSEVGGFVGAASRPMTCTDSHATGNVTGGYTTSVGGFVGALRSAAERSSFLNCTASGNVTNTFYGGAGGFVGKVEAPYTTFTGCSASGDVASRGNSNPESGGFVGNAYAADLVFTNCVASGTVATIYGSAGGFVGAAVGARSRFLSCTASGNVMKPVFVNNNGNYYGGFVAYTTASGIRFEDCRALGCVCAAGMDYVGGFAGSIGSYSYKNVTNELIRCMAAGPVKGGQNVGGFCGWFTGAGSKVTECFALGDVTACENNAGGFAGRISRATTLRDSYALGNVKSADINVGGFAGAIENVSGTSLTRCYSAGGIEDHCHYRRVGAFVGDLENGGGNVRVVNCVAYAPDSTIPLHALGDYPAGTTTVHVAIAEFGRDDFKSRTNFEAFHAAVENDDTPIWAQVDGVTQPYLKWSAPEGSLSVYAIAYGDGGGSISGGGEYEPGEEVEISAVPGYNRFFAGWSGSAQYADAKNSQTTLVLDNHRVATTQFGRYIHTADELQALTNDLDSVVGLANSIDLSLLEWVPLYKYVNEYKGFTGKFFGMGHQITGLVATNTASGSGYKGLFGYTVNAVLDGIDVSGVARGSQCVGGLVGKATATLITNCTARVEVTELDRNTSNNGPFGGLAGEIHASTLVGCRADGFVRGRASTGGLVGFAGGYNLISGCVARGDVFNFDIVNAYNGGFVGTLSSGSGNGTEVTFLTNCWCSGAVWGRGNTVGAFVGTGGRLSAVVDCAVADNHTGRRKFNGYDDNENFPLVRLTAEEIAERSAGWPAPMERDLSQAKHITNAEELAAVRNDLSGIYILDRDINLRGATWTPIGNSSTGFSGEFYGNNHRIRNFTVRSEDGYDGFFGCIAGGRVKGLRLKGSVDARLSTSMGSYTYAGGFAGLIGNGSLVEDCSFDGAVTGVNYNVGGFVGKINTASVVAGCCATGTVHQLETSPAGGAGGFVGYLDANTSGCRVFDCYALVDVDAESNRQVGGFIGYVNNRNVKVDTSYCSGSVTNTTEYRGAFIGYLNAYASITNSYYNSDAADGRLALGTSSKANSNAKAGITPLSAEEMKHAANFANFDFVKTWGIFEGESTPYLLALYVSKTGYELWLDENGIGGDPEPEEIGNGIPYGVRYVFDIPMSKGPGDFTPPMFHIAFDANGKPYVKLPKQENDEGVRVEVLASTDLADFSKENIEDWTDRVEMMLAEDGCWVPKASIDDSEWKWPDAMFFAWRIEMD